MPDWFRRRDAASAAQAVPEGLFTHCKNEKCKALLYTKDFERDLKVCPRCGYHHPLTADERIAFTVDPDTFVEHDADLAATDPLDFPEYRDKIAKGTSVTGRSDTMVSGVAAVGGWPCSVLVADFRFMGGSMGSVFGEKFVRAADRAIENRTALVTFVASGGARMQEGLLGLMQMAKTSAAIAQMGEERVPYVVVLTHPTTGGAFASFASLGDVIFAEPGAYVAFAGARVAQQAKQFKEPPNYQTAEFQHEHGMVDRIVPRKEMQQTLARTLAFFGAAGSGSDAESPAADESAAAVRRNGKAAAK